MRIFRNKKILSAITAIFILLMSFSAFSLVDISSPLADETTELDDFTNTLRSSAVSFFDDFESGLSKWQSITGLWHLTDTGSAWPDPCHSPIHSMWFGNEATGNFDTGFQEYGEMVSIPFSLVGFTSASLEFYHWRAGEGDPYDVSYVYISINGINWDLLYESAVLYIAPWEQVSLDISGYIGNPSVQLRFYFDSIDAIANDYRGWLVDDIQVITSGGGLQKVAILNADGSEWPAYFDGVWNNDYLSIYNGLIAAGKDAIIITNADILSGVLSDVDVLILIDNVPSDAASIVVRDWALTGGCVISFDSSICFLNWAGLLPPEAVGTNGYGTYWDYNSPYQGIVVNDTHPIMAGYNYGDIISGTTGDAEYFSDMIIASLAGPYYTPLVKTDFGTNFDLVVALEAPYCGRVVHVWDQAHWNTVSNQPMILNAIEWGSAGVEPSMRIGFIRTHQEREMLDLKLFYENLGYPVDEIYSTITEALLSDYHIIFVSECWEETVWDPGEITAIENWMQNGGVLIGIGDEHLVEFEQLAATHGIAFLGYPIGSSGSTSVINSSHPLMSGVTSLYIPSVLNALDVSTPATPIFWDSTGTGVYGAAVEVGLGRLCVIADDLWFNVYDDDNEILFENILSWYVEPSIHTILFDEAHLPLYSIGSNPAYEVTGGYSEFPAMLTAAGYIVDTIDPGTVIDATVLSKCDILVIVASQSAYSTAELDAIEAWVAAGGSLLLMPEHTSLGVTMEPLVNRFGFDFKNDAILDSDDGVGTGDPSQIFYDGANIISHPITTGVSRVEMYAGDGLIAAPVDETPIIITDTDGTATWWSDGSPALGVSIMSVVDGGSVGAGKVCVIGDSNLWDSAYDVDSDGDIDFYDSDNEILAMNTINWLTPTLPGSLNVTSPDSSSSWETGTTHSITWTSEGSISDVKIELFKDGLFVLEIIASTDNDGEFSWTIPSGLDDSTQYQINISDVSNPDTYDLSDNFEIFTTPEITVTSPDSSSSWETGTTQSITWTSEGSISDVKIELFKDGAFELEIIASTANDGEFSWTIPSGLDDSTQYQINISDVSNPDTYDFSDNFEIFTIPEVDSLIIITPGSSSSWETGTTQSITWTSTGSISDVKIELFKEGAFELEIIASTANDGEFSWTIPSGLDNSTQYQIKITDATNPTIEDISDNFEIFTTPEVDSLTVTNPSSLTAWEMGTSHTITWTSTGSITNVKIELFKDGVLTLQITASTANDGSYTWDIPTDLEDGIDYQIKISDVSNPATYDESPDFAITSVPIPEDGGIPSYNLYILIGIICVVSVILVKNRKKIILK